MSSPGPASVEVSPELRCGVIDGWLNIPCGFPAAGTIQHKGKVVGICEHDTQKAIAAGYVVTPLLPAGDTDE